MTTRTGQALVSLLEAYGVDTVFGIPGVHTLELYAGLEGSSIRHVQPRHEQGAGFMADGYARAGGRPGVCFLISGPGVTNAVTAMGQAFADSTPMLVISSDTTSASQGKGWGCLHEVSDLTAVTRPVTAFAARVESPGAVPDLLGRAFAVFAAGRPRPVHISIPIDVLSLPAQEDWRTVVPPARPRPESAAVERAASLLAGARAPLILVGGGTIGAANAIRRLAERLAAPVISSIRGKGIVPDSHPLALGGAVCHPAGHDLVAAADVVLAVGTELSETDSFVERLDIPGALVRVDIDPAKIDDRYPPAAAIIADAEAAVEALEAALGGRLDARKSAAGTVHERVAAARRRMTAGLDYRERRHAVFLDALRAALPADAMVFGDMCQVVYTGAFRFPVEAPGRWHCPAGYCTLGCALPNAVGACLAAPAIPVVALAGDGGFMFTCQELVTAAELELPLPVVVWNNRGYQQIRDDMLARGQEPIGVSGVIPDFEALAAAFGAGFHRPRDGAGLADALSRTLAGRRPALILVDEDDPWLGETAPRPQ